MPSVLLLRPPLVRPFAAAHGVVDGVHGDAAVVRPFAEPAAAPGFADGDVLMIGVGNLPDGGAAIEMLNLHTERSRTPGKNARSLSRSLISLE
jgi:hypothetical protein